MKKSTSKIVMSGVKAAAGFAAGRIVSRVPIVNANPMLRIAAPLAGAFLTHKMMGVKGAEIAAGMVTASAVDAVATFAPGIAAQTGIAGLNAGPSKSLYLPGVAGPIGRMNEAPVEIRMQ